MIIKTIIDGLLLGIFATLTTGVLCIFAWVIADFIYMGIKKVFVHQEKGD